MWKDLSAQWQIAFYEAWEAYKSGGVPIGAAIFDKDGALVIKDHNRSGEAETVNKLISHAEANCLRRLDLPDGETREATLYTTMEPCPMCMCTCVMAHIRHLRYGARDPYCGMAHIKDTEPFFISKDLDYTFEGGETEYVQIFLHSYYELGRMERGEYGDKVYKRFKQLCPDAAEAAERLYPERVLERSAEDGEDFAGVYDRILSARQTA